LGAVINHWQKKANVIAEESPIAAFAGGSFRKNQTALSQIALYATGATPVRKKNFSQWRSPLQIPNKQTKNIPGNINITK
jgi:hypothetical protein